MNEHKVYEQLLLSVLRDKNTLRSRKDNYLFGSKIEEQITERDSEYTNILKHFVCITRVRNWVKEILKWTFYIIIMAAMTSIVVMSIYLLNTVVSKSNIEQLIKFIPLFITSIVSLVSVIITIPVTIARYLFSTKEDENITKIILHTQDHDTSGREWTLHFHQNGQSDKGNTNPEEIISM